MTAPNATKIGEAYTDFLGGWKWDWFCTLTFRYPVHPEAADKLFRVWISKVNRRLYGSRWSKHNQGVYWARAMEWQKRDVIHYHVLVGGQGLVHLRRFDWMGEWEKLAGFARIEPPRGQGAVRGYCSKYIAKGGEIDIGGPLEDSPVNQQTAMALWE